MHEYSLVQALIEQAEATMRAHGAIAVKRLTVSIGDRAGVEPELFERAFETFRERTVCEGGILTIRHTTGPDLILERVELEVPDPPEVSDHV